jgi:multidrug efflux system outer membrane protein
MFAFLAFCLVGAAGCASLGPEYQRPELGASVPRAWLQGPEGSGERGAQERWWEAFGRPALDRLVQDVLERNLDIREAAARVLEVRARLTSSRAERFPRVDLEAGARRQRQTVTTTVPTLQGPIREERRATVDSHNLSLPASFELDLWGRLARAEEAALQDLLQAEENRRTVIQGAVAEAVSLYLQTEALERRLHITRGRIENYEQSLALVERRYEHGLTSILDVRQARRSLARAQALLPPIRQDLGKARHALSVLAGRYPEAGDPGAPSEIAFRRMAPVPAGVPSDLLERRPDIRAAEASLRASNARVGEALASRFPRISLTGSFGYSSETLNRLLEPESELWNIAMGVAYPLFDAGRLKASQRAAEARYRQGAAAYARTVLGAFAEVEDALLTRREQLERRKRVLEFLEEARVTQEVAESRYRRGLVDYLNVLEAVQTRYQAEEDVVLVDLAIATNRVALHRALGGGWPSSAETTNRKTSSR